MEYHHPKLLTGFQPTNSGIEIFEMFYRHTPNSFSIFVRLIHGKGTGRLRQVIQQELRKIPHVASFEDGGEKEGGEGVTVVKLKKN